MDGWPRAKTKGRCKGREGKKQQDDSSETTNLRFLLTGKVEEEAS
jgi:hypothetical protein